MLRTLGIPTRSWERSLFLFLSSFLPFPLALGVAAEGFCPNQVCNIWIGIFGLLNSGLDYFHLVQIFDQPFGAGVVDDDAFPALGKGDFAPFAALAAEQFDVDEAALASYGTPVTDGVDRGSCFVGKLFDGIESAEGGVIAFLAPFEGNERSADGSGFAGVGMDDDVGFGNFGQDEIHLSFYDREILVSTALEDELLAG